MTFLALFVGLGAILVFLIVQLNNKKPSAAVDDAEPEYAPPGAHLDVGDARVGDSVSIPGVGDEYDDLDFRVEKRNRYESDGERWYELVGNYRGRRVYLELVEDDELEVWLDRGDHSLRLADLGLDEETLARMDEQRDHGAGFEWDGERWNYASSYEAGYFANSVGSGEGFYTWCFYNRNRDRQVWIEKWIDEPFEAGVSQKIPVQDVRLFRA